MPSVATFDFHVTSECSQECAYCWGPQGIPEVDTATALEIVTKIASHGSRRVVFTGGDPLQRADIGELIRHAATLGLEVAVSTTGDKLTAEFLDEFGGFIDLVSLPLDGASEAVSSRTKTEGHFAAVMTALDLLAEHPDVDVKVATPVTKHNVDDVPNIARLLDDRAERLPGRLFYNVFQAFPRSMDPDVDWTAMVVSDADYAAMRNQVEASPHGFRINWLTHETLDKLYVMVFPDGSLTVPVGTEFRNYGMFLDIDDLDELLRRTDFDAPKHQLHSQGWSRLEGLGADQDPH
ncbi:MAG: radical SAM protein [Acidimicrobiia bacterium]|nr:radical SAM protein [Acidimicrobiia bacterium]